MKIAIAQINPVIADISGNEKKIIEYINRAETAGSELTVFPEMSIIGYPPMDLLENKKLIDDNIYSLSRIAACVKTAAVVGFVDYNRSMPPMLYNSAAFIQNGKIKAVQYKTLLPQYDVFDETRYFSSSEKFYTIEYKNFTIGITICEDIWNAHISEKDLFMENRYYETDPVKELKKMGANLIINISASPFVRGKNSAKIKMLRSIAKEQNIHIIYVNQIGGNDSLIFDGSSLAINNKGTITAAAEKFKEDMLITDTSSGQEINLKINEIEDVKNALVLGIRDYVTKCGFKKTVLGLSGGIDSALTAALAVEALGPENVTGVTMPSVFSSSGSVDDSVMLAKNLGIKLETIPIHSLCNEYKLSLSNVFKGLAEDITEENIQARVRGNLLMAISNKTGALLLTTGNKSELAMGYCTLYGDMSGGLAVISDLPKTAVYELSRYINLGKEIIPQSSIDKAPSAELRENQKDEDSLPPYPMLDKILELYIEQKKSSAEISACEFDEILVKDILKKVNLNEYKRRQAAPGLKVTSKSFGTGRRIPMAQKFIP
jgi:NAD+ synthase (glutamine-hydrolysing)